MIRILFPLLLLAACAQPQGARVDLNQVVNRKQLDTLTTPLLAAQLTGPGTLATMVPTGRNGPRNGPFSDKDTDSVGEI